MIVLFLFSNSCSFDISVCEESKNYLWDLTDKVGSGATSNVYKAYNKQTGEMVAAKVSKMKSTLSNIQPRYRIPGEPNPGPRSIFDREINFLKNSKHENIVRFIGIEIVTSSNGSYGSSDYEVLFLEYCNGGSIGDMLRIPSNRYGLSEDVIMQIMKDVISALKYLRRQNIIHRDIKPDNIMQSIDINGKATYKLTDLGVARQINQDELTSDSICGTIEYIHPVVYCAVFPDIKVNVNGKAIKTRMPFPFEVEMWSFGVTLYQCSTGRIPFQPFDGTRSDRETMRKILTTIPMGCISGIQNTRDGDIQWSKRLPEWCRLSLNLKDMLAKLLSGLFETKQDRLMKHEEFFDKIDEIINLIPIYYLNLKTLTLTCAYFHGDQSINKLFDEIRKENGDDVNVDYYILFQNIHYPISNTESISMKTFCEQLPVHPSREKPLVIYTFSSLKFDQKCAPKVDIPEIQPKSNIQDVFFSVFDWSKNLIGLFFYLKNQLIEYEYIMKITHSSITTIQRTLKSKLLQLLSSIRNELFDYRALHELQRIIDVIESKHNSISEEAISSEHQSLSRIRPILQSSTDLYHKLIEYDKELTTITDQNFNDQLILNTSHIFKQINKYSLHIQQTDTYVKNAIDLSERFRRDTMISRPSSLQMASHLLREKLLQEVYDQYIHLINKECYPLIIEISNEYRKWIKQQAGINQEIQRIQFSYENQCKTNLPINNLRQIISNELQNMSTIDIPLFSDHSSMIHLEDNYKIHQDQQLTTVHVDGYSSQSSMIVNNEIYFTMQKTIDQAENNSNLLNDMIKRLHQQSLGHTIN